MSYDVLELLDCPPVCGIAAIIDTQPSLRNRTHKRSTSEDLLGLDVDHAQVFARADRTTPESINESQPVLTPCVSLWYEGRVDNRKEIAARLGRPTLATAPDGEVLAAAFSAWGPELPAKVIGEFAFIAFERRSRKWSGGTDSLGVRRLFFGTAGGQLFITTNLRLLFEVAPEFRSAYNRDVVREYFAGTMTPWSGHTIWKGIFELGRGAIVSQQGSEWAERVIWQPERRDRTQYNSPAEVEEIFRTLLFDAVASALRAPGPVLCDLSGGYDSSTVFSVAASLIASGEVAGQIIGWSYVNQRSNERAFQQAVRGHFGIIGYELEMADHPPFRRFTDTEIPTGSFIQMGALNRATRLFAQRHGIRARLTGQAGDPLLQKLGGGAPVYLADLLRDGRIREWHTHVRAYLHGGSYNAWQLLRECTIGTLDLHVGLRRPIPNWITRRFRNEIRSARDEFLHVRSRAFQSAARERAYRWTQIGISYPLGAPPHSRVPLASRPLAEFLLNLDWKYLMVPNEERALLRRSLQGILPDAVTAGGRCWTAFSAGLYDGLRAAWPRVSSILSGDQLAELGVIEPRPFRSALEAMRVGYEGPNPQFAKTALYLEAWLGMKALQQTATRHPSSAAGSVARLHSAR